MEPHHPSRFPVEDTGIYDAYIASRKCAAMAVASRLGLFDFLESGPKTLKDLGRKIQIGERPLQGLASALHAMGLLVKEASGSGEAANYRLSTSASAYLVRGKEGWLGGLIEMEIEQGLSPATLLQSVQRGEAAVYGGENPWDHHEGNPQAARIFTQAMHSVSERPAAGLAEVIDFSSSRKVLDVGGGSGALSIAIAREWEHIECHILDLPSVCQLATEYIATAGLTDRIQTRTGDMFGDPLPDGFDVVLFSQILHDWPLSRGAQLLKKASECLPSGGKVLIHEKLVGGARDPVANALVNLDMLAWTEGQQYDENTLRTLLVDSGFCNLSSYSTAGYWTVVEGLKK